MMGRWFLFFFPWDTCSQDQFPDLDRCMALWRALWADTTVWGKAGKGLLSPSLLLKNVHWSLGDQT